MESIAKTKYIRISPRKMRLVANELRGYDFLEAIDILKNMKKKAAAVIKKVLLSAGANAKILNPDVLEKDLYIRKINIDKGVTWKRFKARARGRGSRILRRTSNLVVVLSDE